VAAPGVEIKAVCVEAPVGARVASADCVAARRVGTEVLLAWDPPDPISDAPSGRIANVLTFWGSMATVPVGAVA
jgi:hypothetical protein